MSVKITIRQASIRYGVNERTIQRWVKRYEVHKFSDDTYDLAQLDALVENYGRADYLQVNWGKAACEGLPTEMFYKIEEKNVRKIVDMKIFRDVCATCPIWADCLGYAVRSEDWGVWGGMTTEERRAMEDPAKIGIRNRVVKDFARYGITEAMINEAVGL